MPKAKIPFGPTYDEMLNPNHQDKAVRKAAEKALKTDELDPINLFNITWKNEKDEVNKIVLPKELTGVDANIVVLLGKYFPQFDFKEEDIRRISRFQSATPGDFGNLSSRLRFMNQEKVTETYITDEICKMQEEKEYGKRSIGFSD